MMIKSQSLPKDNGWKWHFIKFCLMADHLFPPLACDQSFPSHNEKFYAQARDIYYG